MGVTREEFGNYKTKSLGMSRVGNITGSFKGLELQAPDSKAMARAASGIKGYCFALLLVLAVGGFRWWFDPILQDLLPFAFFAIPVLVIAWREGLGASVFAAALGLLVGLWFFVEPRHSFAIVRAAGWVAMGVYLFTAMMICLFAEKLRRANARSQIKAAELTAKHELLMAEAEVRKRAEQALSASESRYLAVIQATPSLVWTALPDGAWDFTNTQWERYTGMPFSESLGDGWKQVLHLEDSDRVVTAWKQALESGRGMEQDMRLRGQAGIYRWFKARAVPIVNDDGQIMKWLGTCTDINVLMETQEILARNQEELERRIQERTADVGRLKSQLQAENLYLRERVRVREGHHRIVGQSEAIQRALAQAEQVARTDTTVLLLGETGTGKELLAESIHELSARKSRPLVSVNCAAMPGALVESELFGREKGAFTGSLSRQVGRFELADQATIFLDEVGELSLEVQAKLLRVLEAKQVERLGNPRPISVDVRIIAATNRDLEKAVAEGKFRQDLYYRLNVFPITVPPLRSRREDIPLLVWAFVDEFAKRFNKNIESIERASMDALQRHTWPGNIRELRNLIERAMIVANGQKLRIQLPAATTPCAAPHARKLEEVEREHMLNVLEESGWRVRGANGAAAKLGLKPTTLEARMAKLGIRRPGAEDT